MMATTDAGEGIRDPQGMAMGGERDKGEGSVVAVSPDDGSQGRQGSGVKEKETGKGVGEGCVENAETRKQAAALERQKEGGATTHNAEQSDTIEKGSDRRGESATEAEGGEFGGGHKLIGRKTSKKFGRRTFAGEVVSFDEEQKWYKVSYEDGDEEELEWLELQPTLQPLPQGSSLMAPTSSIETPLGKRPRKESARLTESLHQFGSLSFTVPRPRRKNKGKGKDNPEKAESKKQSQPTKEVGKETPKVAGEVAVEEKKETGKTATVGEVVVIEENDGEDVAGTDRETKEDAVVIEVQPKGTGKAGAKDEAGKAGAKDEAGKAGTKDEAGKAGAKDEAGKAGAKDEAGKAGAKDEAGKAGPKDEAGKAGAKDEAGKAGAKDEAKPVNKGGLKKSTGKGKEKAVEQKVNKGEKRKDKEKDAGNGKAGEKGSKDVAVPKHAQKRQKTGEKEKQGGEKRKNPMVDVQKSPAELSQKPLKKDKKSEGKPTSKAAEKASTGTVAENGKEKAKKPGGEEEKSAQQVKKKQVDKAKSVSQKAGGESPLKGSKTPTKGAKLELTKAKSADKATEIEEVVVETIQKAGEAAEKVKAQGEKKVSSLDKPKQTQSTSKKPADKNGAQKDSKPAAKVEKAPSLTQKGHTKKDKADGNDVNTTTQEAPVSKGSKGRGKKMIGEKLRKLFDGKLYNGEVVGYDPRYNYYKVKYEDGDEEELVWRELEPILIWGTGAAVKEKEAASAPSQSGKKKGQGNVSAKSKSLSPTTVEGTGEGGSSSSLKRKRAPGENGTNDNKKTEVKGKSRSSAAKREPKSKVLKTSSLASAKHTSPSNDNSAAAPATPPAMPPCPATGQQMMVRTAVPSKALFQERNTLDYFAWGEVAQFVKGRLPPLQAAELLPVSGPIAQLAVSHHHMAAITTSGHVFVWRNRHGNIFSRTNEWEFIPDLENKDIQIVDIAGPDLYRKQSGYEPQEEDQVPDPFYLAAVDKNGQDYVLVGSQAQERPVRTMRLTEEPRYPGLKDALALTDSAAAAEVGLVIQLSVGTVEAPDESPFIGYITDRGRVYIRSATKDFMEEVNTVTGYTGKPIKIQCGRVYHAIILTDDGCAWTWGRSSFSASSPIGLGSLCDTSDSQPSLASCRIASGTLSARKVIDVGCYGEDFVALTSDGQVHQWSYAATDQGQAVNTIPGPPHSDYLPRMSPEDPLVKVSVGVGVCAGISASGKVHTWRNGMTGCLVGMYLQVWDALTPLGRNEDGGQAADTCVSALGARVAFDVKCVAGSLIIGVTKKGRARPAAKRKVETV